MEYTKIPFGGSLVLKFFNPLFNDISSYSLPMSFNGKISYIRRAFGYPDKRDSEIKPYLEGRIKTQFCDFKGSWGVNEAGENISAYFKPGSGDFYSLIKDKLLSDIDFGGVKYPVGEYHSWSDLFPHLDAKMNVSYPDSEYAAFTVCMPNAVNMPDASILLDHEERKLVNLSEINEEGNAHFISYYGPMSVYLFAGSVIDYLFTSMGYKIEENIFRKDIDLKQLVIFNTFNLRPFPIGDFLSQARIDYKNLVPHISCSDFLKAIRDRFNIGFFINEQKKSVRIKSFDHIISDGVNFSICNTRPKTPTIINNRVPGITFPLNEPDAWSTHSYKSADELTNPVIVSRYRDILPLTRTPGDLIFVQSESAYYRIALNDADPPVNEAQRICTDMFPYSDGDGTGEITQLSGIPAMYTHTINQAYHFIYQGGTYDANTDADYLIPRCDLVGNGYGQPFTEFPLMFLFARGMINCNTIQPAENPNDIVWDYANLAAFPPVGESHIRYLAIDTGYFYRWYGTYVKLDMPEQGIPPNYNYPLGTSDVYDAAGSKLSTANLALKWGGDYGLIEKFWTNRINWEMNIKKLIKTEMLSEDIPKLIDMDEWKRIGDDNYLVNSFEIAVEGKKVRLRNVELLRL